MQLSTMDDTFELIRRADESIVPSIGELKNSVDEALKKLIVRIQGGNNLVKNFKQT